MIFHKILSNGCPFFSYMANRKNGSMTSIMQSAAVVFPTLPLIRKNSGMPTRAPPPKQMSCLFVRLKRTFVLTAVRSFGTGT